MITCFLCLDDWAKDVPEINRAISKQKMRSVTDVVFITANISIE